MTVGITHVLLLSAGLFGIGVGGLLTRHSVVGMVLALELMLNGACVALVGFARFGFNGAQPLAGMSFALVVIVVAVGETAAAAGLLVLVARRHGTVVADEFSELQG